MTVRVTCIVPLKHNGKFVRYQTEKTAKNYGSMTKALKHVAKHDAAAHEVKTR